MAPQHRRRRGLTLRPPGPGDEAGSRAVHEQLRADGFEFLLADGSWEQVLAHFSLEAADVHRVLVTCDETNVGSEAVIENTPDRR